MREVIPGIFIPTTEEIEQQVREFCRTRDVAVLDRYMKASPEMIDLQQTYCDLDEEISRQIAELQRELDAPWSPASPRPYVVGLALCILVLGIILGLASLVH